MLLPIMTGTTGSTFQTVAAFSAGNIGYREIGEGFRIRVEPTPGTTLALGSDWTQPSSDQKRYSKVVGSATDLAVALAFATTVLSLASVKQ